MRVLVVILKITGLTVDLPLSRVCFPLLVSQIHADLIFLLVSIPSSLSPHYSNRDRLSSFAFLFYVERRWCKELGERVEI